MAEASDLDPVEDALATLRDAIARKLRAEQLVDGLTRLGNDGALEAWLQERLTSGGDFWLAFLEVDHFKVMNDRFGYSDADVFLKRIADQLRNAAANHLPPGTFPVRAHGDEFYLAGDLLPGWGPAEIGTALDHIRSAIALMKIRIRDRDGGADKMLAGTVSVGWLTTNDSREAPGALDSRRARHHLELAVAEAKRQRNVVCRFEPTMRKADEVDGRADCTACRTKLTYRIPTNELRDTGLHCPNCNGSIAGPDAG